jgi:TP901 family phage tail tape measure protein
VETLGYDGTLKFDTSVDSSGFQTGISKISSLAGSALKATTAIIGGAATAVAGIGTAAVKVGMDFESAMSNVAAISGATGEDLEALTEKAKEMGSKTKFSATESADAFSYMAMAGWKTEDMLNGIEGIMNLAAASGEDLATTSDIVTDALTAFGLQASDSGHFADVLAAASSNANTNVGLMGETFKYVAPVAGALGFSAEDCATAIGLMANAGIKGSQAGTSLRSIMSRMAKPTDEVQTAMDALGVSLTDSEGNMKSLNEIMLDLREGFSGLSESEKAQMAAALGGQEAMSGLLAIVNASDDDFNKLSEAIYGCDGAAAEMADTMNDNLSGQFTILKSGLEGLGIALYEEMETPLKDIVKAAQEMVSGLTEAFNDGGLDGLVDKAGEILAEIAQSIAEAAPGLIQMAVDLCNSFIESIMANSDEFAAAGAELVASLAQAILEFAGNFWSAGIELFRKLLEGIADHATEIGQTAATMISQLASAFIENLPLIIQAGKDIFAGFLQGMSEEFPGVSAFLQGFFSGLTDTLGPAIEGIVEIVKKIFEAFDSADPATLEAIGKAVGTIAGAMVGLKVVGTVKSPFSIFGSAKGIISGVAGVFPKLVEGFQLVSGGAGTLTEVLALEFPKIGGIVSKIPGVFTSGGLLSSIGSAFSGMASTALSGLAGLGSTIASGIGSVVATLGGPLTLAIAAAIAAIIAIICNWDAVKEFFTDTLPNWWTGTVVPFFQSIGESIGEFFSSIPEKLGEVFSAIGEWFAQLPDKIITAISTLGEKFVEWGASMLETATTVVTSIIDGIVTWFSELPYKIGYAIGFVIGTLVEWGASVIEWITTNVPLIIEGIVKFFSELPGKIWTWLTNTFNNLVQWGSDMLQKAIEVAQNCVENISNFFSQLPGKIATWLSNTLSNLITWAGNMLSNARQAASNVIDAIVQFFSQLPGKIWTWLTNTIQKVIQWGSDMVAKGRQAASDLCDAVINGVRNLPSQMMDVGYHIVTGVWNGICNAASWFRNQVSSFFSGIVDGAKSALGINSPSRVFAEEVGEWIPPGIGEGVEDSMPDLIKDTDAEMAKLAKKMQTSVRLETGKITLDKNTSQTYQVERENGQAFDDSKTDVTITGDIHTHVDLDGTEVGNATTPIVDKNMGRIDTHKKRGG